MRRFDLCIRLLPAGTVQLRARRQLLEQTQAISEIENCPEDVTRVVDLRFRRVRPVVQKEIAPPAHHHIAEVGPAVLGVFKIGQPQAVPLAPGDIVQIPHERAPKRAVVVVGQLQLDNVGQQFLSIPVAAEVLLFLAIPGEFIYGIPVLLAEAPIDVFAHVAQRGRDRFVAEDSAK